MLFALKPTTSNGTETECNIQNSASRVFVGSGVIEAACKTVIGSRLKQSGMFWDSRRGQCHHRSSPHPTQWKIRGLLGSRFNCRLNHPHLCRAPGLILQLTCRVVPVLETVRWIA